MMVKTTRKQREAILKVWKRFDPIHNRITYRDFRRTIQPTFGMDSAVVVHWCGMWLAIEKDGYTHS